MKAKEKLVPKGKCILQEKPFVYVLKSMYRTDRCDHCLSGAWVIFNFIVDSRRWQTNPFAFFLYFSAFSLCVLPFATVGKCWSVPAANMCFIVIVNVRKRRGRTTSLNAVAYARRPAVSFQMRPVSCCASFWNWIMVATPKRDIIVRNSTGNSRIWCRVSLNVANGRS